MQHKCKLLLNSHAYKVKQERYQVYQKENIRTVLIYVIEIINRYYFDGSK